MPYGRGLSKGLGLRPPLTYNPLMDSATTHTPVAEAAARVQAALRQAARGLVDRDVLIQLVALAAVAGEHLLIIGPPGTAKSEAIRRVARAIDGRYFEYLLGRFTEPNEIFGPVDLRRLREGELHTDTTDMLPEAELAFLDEVFLGSTAILNTLLGVLNERIFRRGHTRITCPLRLCVGASNALPTDPGLAAFADRFLLRSFVAPVADPMLEDLLAGGWAAEAQDQGPVASLSDLDVLAAAARRCDLEGLRPLIAQAVRRLRKAGLHLSDRRVVKVQKLTAAAAALAGRDRPIAGDLWPLIYAMPTPEAQESARALLHDLLATADNGPLSAAAEHAAQGPLARASLLVERAHALLAARPAPGADDEPWRLKLEGIARAIDAGFAPEAMPEALQATRRALVEILSPEPTP